MTSDEQWFVRSHGKAIGPFSTERLARWWSRGDYDDDTLVRRAGEEDWVRITETPICGSSRNPKVRSEPESATGDAAELEPRVPKARPTERHATTGAVPPPIPTASQTQSQPTSNTEQPSRRTSALNEQTRSSASRAPKEDRRPATKSLPPAFLDDDGDSRNSFEDSTQPSRQSGRNRRTVQLTNPSRQSSGISSGITVTVVVALLVFVIGVQTGWILHSFWGTSDQRDSLAQREVPRATDTNSEGTGTRHDATGSPSSATSPASMNPSNPNSATATNRGSVSNDRATPDVDPTSSSSRNDQTQTVDSTPSPQLDAVEDRDDSMNESDGTGGSNVSPLTSEPTSVDPLASDLNDSVMPSDGEPTIETENPEPMRVERLRLYQSADILRQSQFELLASPLSQELHYQLRSELLVSPADENGVRQVSQRVLDAVVVNVDPLSRPSLVAGLEKLKGWQFEFKVNRLGEVIEWRAGPPADSDVAEVTVGEDRGTLVSTVLDEDGWKEISQLTMFSPIEANQDRPLERQMTHDFGALGSWYGTSLYQRQVPEGDSIDYQFMHRLTYEAPDGDEPSTLPFKVVSASLSPQRAEGTLRYDQENSRVSRVTEWFEVKGSLQVEALGSTVPIEFMESQRLHVMIDDKPMWDLRDE